MCYIPTTIATRSYVVAPYAPDLNNNMSAQIPNRCTHNTIGQDKCKIYFDHSRLRKTGPEFPLMVVRCRTHRIAFTLYPPGFSPWGRSPWVRLAPDGGQIHTEEGIDFRGTYFEAALDAAEDVFCLREQNPDEFVSSLTLVTQQCHLQRSAQLLGFGGAPIEAFSQTLDLSGQQFHEALAAVKAESDQRVGLGKFVAKVLSVLSTATYAQFERIAACGAAVGLWPQLYVWQPHIFQLRPRVFFHRECAAGRAFI